MLEISEKIGDYNTPVNMKIEVTFAEPLIPFDYGELTKAIKIIHDIVMSQSKFNDKKSK